MQGRLSQPCNNKIQSFPKTSWQDEFSKARSCDFEVIEWVFDEFDNPILESDYLLTIQNFSEKHEIKINSVCADFFMENKLFDTNNAETNLKVFTKLIENCHKLNIKYVEIPLVDSSSLKNDYKIEQQFVRNINQILTCANDNDVTIVLETDLTPTRFLKLVECFKFNVFANYDTGNSTFLGYDVNEELSTYGNMIKNIHIKDRMLHGSTVPLGDGDTDFELFFSALKKIDYSGDLIIQGAREQNSLPEKTCLKYFNFVKQYLDKYF